MFESAELGHTVDSSTYGRRAPDLRADLLDAQYDLVQAKSFATIILLNGVDGAGKGEVLHLLSEWMDTRHLRTHAFGPREKEDEGRPAFWRFWQALPPKGKIALFVGNWYAEPILVAGGGHTKPALIQQQVDSILRFEQLLVDEGILLLKFWLHLSKQAQRKRFEELEGDRETRWQVTKSDRHRHRRYSSLRRASEHILGNTNTAHAPWTVVESTCPRYRDLMVAETIRKELRARLDGTRALPTSLAPPLAQSIDRRRLLSSIDLHHTLSKERYERALADEQRKLNRLTRKKSFAKRGVVIVFEGPDAAGKGGAIRRLTAALDARFYEVIPVSAPSEEERAQPYLWRFWRHVPRLGHLTIYDRSWYGRVLVERVEKLTAEADWMRAYSEINDYEAQLVESELVVVKLWFWISQAEQLRRFRERETMRFKRFKITPDDWRNREKWDDYEVAACDMVDRTSTDACPWTLVASDDKQFARVRALHTIRRAIERAL